MDKNIIHWRWIPRYYRKVDDKASHVDVVYWYFGLETVFIVVMAFVFYFTTIKDGAFYTVRHYWQIVLYAVFPEWQ